MIHPRSHRYSAVCYDSTNRLPSSSGQRSSLVGRRVLPGPRVQPHQFPVLALTYALGGNIKRVILVGLAVQTPTLKSQYTLKSWCCFLWVGKWWDIFSLCSLSLLPDFSAENVNCFCNKRDDKSFESLCQCPPRVKSGTSLWWDWEGNSREPKLPPRWRVLGIYVLEGLGQWRRQWVLLQLQTIPTVKNGMS